MDKFDQYNALWKNLKNQEKRIHDFANHFSTLHYLIRNQHLAEAEQYVIALISHILTTQEETRQLEQYKKHLLYQLYTLKLLLRSEATSKLLVYIKQMHAQLDTFTPEIYCNHPILNAVLCEKKRIAIEHHINIQYSISFPEKIDMPDIKLLSIFFNLLDNGIEACIQSHAQKPFIRLKVNHKGNMLSIQMTNSKNPTIPFTGKTTKENSQSHGFGLQIIEETLRDHMGYSKWIDHTDTFESILMFAIDV